MQQLKVVSVAVLFLLFIPQQGVGAAAEESPTWIKKANYVAIGDSLAAGMSPDGQVGIGYADKIADKIKEKDALASYNKGFSTPGYTTADVLKDIQQNVTRDVIGSGYTNKTVSIETALEKADIVTISAGANDLLAHIKVDRSTGRFEYNKKDLAETVVEVGTNLNSIQQEIKKMNPNAKIFVMGYYNPFPYLADEAQPMMAQLLGQFNKAIASSTAGTDAVYIETKDEVAKEYRAFLPNPKNIHLSISGYEAVAQLFWDEIKSFNRVPADSIKASDVHAHTARLDWKQPRSESPIDAYKIYDGDQLIATVSGDTTFYILEGLIEKKAYHFTVQSIDEEGRKSEQGIEIKVTTPSDGTLDYRKSWPIVFVRRALETGLINEQTEDSVKSYNLLTNEQAAAIYSHLLKSKERDKDSSVDSEICWVEKQSVIMKYAHTNLAKCP